MRLLGFRNNKEEGIHEEDPRPRVVKPYQPLVPFSQCLAKAKLEVKFGKFLEIFKKLQINIPFLDAIFKTPSYVRFLKEIPSNKRGFKSMVWFPLRRSVKLPPKIEDSGSSSIPYAVGDVSISRALCDLRASVSLMPYSICKRLQVGELKPTTISI